MFPGLSSVRQDHGACGAYGDNLRSNEREGSLRDDGPPCGEPTGSSRNAMVLGERAGVFPITETDSGTKRQGFRTLARRKVLSPVVIRASSKVENDSEDNKADDGQDLDGTIDTMQLLVRISSAGGIVLNRMPTNAKMNSASPYAPIKVL